MVDHATNTQTSMLVPPLTPAPVHQDGSALTVRVDLPATATHVSTVEYVIMRSPIIKLESPHMTALVRLVGRGQTVISGLPAPAIHAKMVDHAGKTPITIVEPPRTFVPAHKTGVVVTVIRGLPATIDSHANMVARATVSLTNTLGRPFLSVAAHLDGLGTAAILVFPAIVTHVNMVERALTRSTIIQESPATPVPVHLAGLVPTAISWFPATATHVKMEERALTKLTTVRESPATPVPVIGIHGGLTVSGGGT